MPLSLAAAHGVALLQSTVKPLPAGGLRAPATKQAGAIPGDRFVINAITRD